MRLLELEAVCRELCECCANPDYPQAESESINGKTEWAHVGEKAGQGPVQRYCLATRIRNMPFESVPHYDEYLKLAVAVSEEPRNATLLPPEVQRLWEACVHLIDKAEFKAVFRYLEMVETKLREATQRLADLEVRHEQAGLAAAEIAIELQRDRNAAIAERDALQLELVQCREMVWDNR